MNFLKIEPISVNGFSLKKLEYKSRGNYISVENENRKTNFSLGFYIRAIKVRGTWYITRKYKNMRNLCNTNQP